MNRTASPRFPEIAVQDPGQPARGASPELLAAAFAATAQVSLITDAEQRILHVSAAFTAITGYREEELLGVNCRILQGPGSDPGIRAAINRALTAGNVFEGDILNYRKDGSPFWNGLSITPLCDAAGTITHFVSVQRDISSRNALQDQLSYEASHDPLTQLPNRFALETYLSARTTDAGPATPATSATLGLVELAGIGNLRNRLGLDAGDEVLIEFATRLGALLSEGDFLAHLGGETFVTVFEGDANETPGTVAARLARLHEAVERPFPVAGRSESFRMSVAPARRTARGRRGEDPVTRTGDTVGSRRHAPDLSADGARLNRDRLFAGGLSMYMQPLVDLRTGEVKRVEALARLILPDGTVVPPDCFVPRLDSDDLDELFRIGLNEALGAVVRWEAAGLVVDVSVNLSPSTLVNPHCARWVRNALRRYGLGAGRLGLELLETRLLVAAAARETIDELVDLGVGLALDDLGSGHSSLKRLSQLPFDSIKVDRGLLADVRSKPVETLSLIATITQLGRDMGVVVVVEGIEDLGLAEAASVLGATLGQGFYFSRPMPEEDLPAWAEAFRLPEGFHLPKRCGRLETALGALAYHWQFTRWSSAHPLDFAECPITAFIAARTGPDDEPRRWHDRQHGSGAGHARASDLLLAWLVSQSTGT
jgi:PAS domain S-box-containing protein/diguanylate cyclase (GGDEF)-like protein